jgi:hypothetical protein
VRIGHEIGFAGEFRLGFWPGLHQFATSSFKTPRAASKLRDSEGYSADDLAASGFPAYVAQRPPNRESQSAAERPQLTAEPRSMNNVH